MSSLTSKILGLTAIVASYTVNAEVCLEKAPSEETRSKWKVCFPLQTQTSEVKGEVCVATTPNEDRLKLRVKSNQGYQLLRNQVWVGEDSQDIPVKSDGASVDLKAFPHRACDFEGETEAHWTFANPCTADKNDRPTTANLVVVAHSIIVDAGISAELSAKTTAWGYEHLEGSGLPAPWFDVTVVCDCSEDDTTRTFLEPVKTVAPTEDATLDASSTGAPSADASTMDPSTSDAPTEQATTEEPTTTDAPTEAIVTTAPTGAPTPQPTPSPTQKTVTRTRGSLGRTRYLRAANAPQD